MISFLYSALNIVHCGDDIRLAIVAWHSRDEDTPGTKKCSAVVDIMEFR